MRRELDPLLLATHASPERAAENMMAQRLPHTQIDALLLAGVNPDQIGELWATGARDAGLLECYQATGDIPPGIDGDRLLDHFRQTMAAYARLRLDLLLREARRISPDPAPSQGGGRGDGEDLAVKGLFCRAAAGCPIGRPGWWAGLAGRRR